MLKLPTAQFVKSAVQVLQHTVPRIRDMVNRELGTSRNINLESLEAMVLPAVVLLGFLPLVSLLPCSRMMTHPPPMSSTLRLGHRMSEQSWKTWRVRWCDAQLKHVLTRPTPSTLMPGLLIQAFQDADLLPEREVDQQRLRTGTGDRLAPKLHATVLNSKLGSTDGCVGIMCWLFRYVAWLVRLIERCGLWWLRRSRQSFDASVLLEAFRGTTIARCKLAAIHLSKRGEFAPSGFYHAEHVATL